jgi:HAD superfamily hydrolase (TIGR01549 family)
VYNGKDISAVSINHICFDLDGTLVKSDKTILKAVIETLNILKIKGNIPEQEFNEVIGLHFFDIFQKFNLDVPDFKKFIDIYKSVYFDFINDSELYRGVEETLIFLKEKNDIKVSLLTTKTQGQAEKIIEHFALGNCFDYIMGRRDGIEYKPSAEPLHFICKKIGVDVSKTLMVGDTDLDINCGKNAGALSCGVTYGYRSRDKLIRYKPDYLIDCIDEIQSLLIDQGYQ